MSRDPKDTRITIIGAGLSGSLLGCALGERGYRVSVFERRADPREQGYIGGRSINLALSQRGLTGLRMVDLDGVVLKDAVPMRGRMMHSPSGHTRYQPYSKNPDDAINSVSRGGLNMKLIEYADRYDNVTFRFGTRFVDADMERAFAVLRDDASGEDVYAEGDLIVGADGAFSGVRSRLQRNDRFNFAQQYLSHGYKELRIPPAGECGVDAGLHDGFALNPCALHIWPRGASMMIALPNADKSFTCTLFWAFEEFEALSTPEMARRHMDRHYPDAANLMPTLDADFARNPIGSLVTVRCDPWHLSDKVVLIGDAAHAIVPFYGQGINAGFEDVRIFLELLDEMGCDFANVLPSYTESRKPNADAIADLALHNFIEMRDHVGSTRFLLKKKCEKLVHTLLPGWYRPLYNLVSFSNVPYAEARELADRQTRIVIGTALVAGALLAGVLLGILFR